MKSYHSPPENWFLPPDKVLIWHSRLVDTDLNFRLTLSLTFYPDTGILISSLFPESSIQFSLSVVSDSLRPHGLQHARPPCPSPTPGACWNSYPLSQWSIQLSHSLLSPSPPAFNLSQHQGLFQWVSSSHQVAKVLEFQLQHQPFQWIFRTDLL